MRKAVPLWIWSIGFIAFDKLIKVVVIAANVSFTLNKGLFFGIGDDGLLGWVIPVCFCLFMAWAAINYGKKHPVIYVILTAALANLSDRLIWGGVLSYIKMGIIPFFNIADLLIIIGIIVLVVSLIKGIINGSNKVKYK